MMLEEVMTARGLSKRSEVIALRFAVGLSVAETAQVLSNRKETSRLSSTRRWQLSTCC
jgi:hypothetical protein